MTRIRLLLGFFVLFLFACGSTNSTTKKVVAPISFSLKNPLDQAQRDVLLHLKKEALPGHISELFDQPIKFESEEQIPFQKNDLDGDGSMDEIALLIGLAANEEKEVKLLPLSKSEIEPTFKKRTQAEISHKINGKWNGREYEGGEFKNTSFLQVPPEHTDHSWFIRYEGPGWESDLVGYRFYLDWRNATDIFGKKIPQMVLQNVGQDGFDSYHEPQAWGMDVLKVGKSLGIGSLGSWVEGAAERVAETDSVNCRIVLNGAIESRIETNYFGWEVGGNKTDVTSNLSIHAGSRLTKHEVELSKSLPNLCTGIVKHENGKLLHYENGAYGYIATWGQQSLAADHLGMAVIYNKNEMQEITEDEHSHVVVFNSNNNKITYYFLATWEQEQQAIQTQEAFISYLNTVVKELGMPISVSF